MYFLNNSRFVCETRSALSKFILINNNNNELLANFLVTNPSGDTSKNQTPPTLLSSLRSVLFVIGTVVIGFAAVCNSLTW